VSLKTITSHIFAATLPSFIGREPINRNVQGEGALVVSMLLLVSLPLNPHAPTSERVAIPSVSSQSVTSAPKAVNRYM